MKTTSQLTSILVLLNIFVSKGHGCVGEDRHVQPPCQDDVTTVPISAPTLAPVEPPTEVPIEPPTDTPIDPPTNAPVEPPTIAPIEPPTEAPIEPPTEAPVDQPSEAPTEAPVDQPTEAPIEPPTEAPVVQPTEAPIEPPTEAPIDQPTEAPIDPPTEAPVSPPTEAPVDLVEGSDTSTPTFEPSAVPTSSRSPSESSKPSSAPSESSVPTVTPAPTPSLCETNEDGFYGTFQQGAGSSVDFTYSLETTPQVDTEPIILLLEREFNNALLPSLFPNECSHSGGRFLRVSRRLQVVGLSARPDDRILENVQCSDKEDPLNDCVLVSASLTLYAQNGDAVAEAERAESVLEQCMNSGCFDNADSDIVKVGYVSIGKVSPPVEGPGSGGDGTTDENARGGGLAVGIIAGASGAALILLAAVAYRRRKQLPVEADNTTLNPPGPSDAPYPNDSESSET